MRMYVYSTIPIFILFTSWKLLNFSFDNECDNVVNQYLKEF